MNRLTVVLLAMLFGAAEAQACRCPQRNLAAYFGAADIVFLGRVRSVRTDEPGARRIVQFDMQGRAYKGEPGSIKSFATPVSSAECGVDVNNETLYLVFATHEDVGAATARFDTCNGTRSFDPKGSEGVQGFVDLEARGVLPKLLELSRKGPTSASGAMLPSPGDPKAELIGLVELPGILGGEPAGAAAGGSRSPISVYSAADAASKVIAAIDSADDVLTREVGYEVPAAVVRRRQVQWYEVALAGNRFGWISADVTGKFHPMADIIVNRLAYLTAAWDGFVWPEPGAGYPTEHGPWRAAERKEMPVNIVATQDVGGSLWLQVEVLSASPCDGGTPNVVLGGWVPGYTAGGKLVAWFYARGC